MSESNTNMMSRIFERVLSFAAIALVVVAGVAIYKMDPSTRGAIWDGIWKSVVWLAFATVLPWSAKLFIQRILDIGSNWAGVALIAVFVILDGVFGMILMNGLPTGGWGWTAALGSISAVGVYSYLVTAYLADTAGY